jgi:hypothetical protein
MEEGILALIIGFTFVFGSLVVTLVVVLAQIRARNHRNQMLHQERMLAIEKGLPIPVDYLERTPRRRPYVRGLVFSALGAGAMVWGAIGAQRNGDWDLFGVGVVFLFVGIALLVADKLTMKKSNGWDAQPSLPYPAALVDHPTEGNRS